MKRGVLSRAFNYIFKGVPVINMTAEITTITNGKLLNDKVVLVTGGSSGLGFSMANKFITEGASVIITGRNEKALITAKEKLGKKCNYIVFDNGNVDDLNDFFNQLNKYGEVNCLVCNAGISLHENDFFDVTLETFDNQFDVNLRGTYFLVKNFIERRKTSNLLNILLITSERGFQCDVLPYGLTKAALNSFCKGLARKYYKDKIRVNGIAPGVTASNMTGITSDSNLYQPIISSGRYFLPEEVAEVASFLLSNSSNCISGEIIATDAGNYISSYY